MECVFFFFFFERDDEQRHDVALSFFLSLPSKTTLCYQFLQSLADIRVEDELVEARGAVLSEFETGGVVGEERGGEDGVSIEFFDAIDGGRRWLHDVPHSLSP